MNLPMLFAGWQPCTPEELAIQEKMPLLAIALITVHIIFNVFLLWLVIAKVKRKPTKILLSILIVILAIIIGFAISILLALSSPACN